MSNWINRRYWRFILLFCWIIYRINRKPAIIRLLRFFPVTAVPDIPQNIPLAFIDDILPGFWLGYLNTCWHRSVLTILFFRKKKENNFTIKVGASRNEDNWSMHIWVEDADGENISDPAEAPRFQALNSFSLR